MATDVATGRVDKKAQIEQKRSEIQEERENAPPEQKAAHGIEYIYRADPKAPTGIWVSSAGPDRTPNTEDDIWVEPPKQLPLVLKK